MALTVYDPDHFVSGNSQYVTKYDEINDAIEKNGVKTVLYLTNGGPNDGATNGYTSAMEVKGNRTLAITSEQGSGIWFRDDVNVVLQYWNRNKQEKDIMTGEGVDDLKEMVDIVNDNNSSRGSATYFVSALIEDGRATTIVIYDSYNNYKRPGDTDKPETTGDVSLEKDNTVLANRVKKLSGTTSVSSRGTGNWRFTITAPEWVVANTNMDVNYDLYVNGVLDTHYTAADVVLSGGIGTISKTENGFQAGDKITIVVTEVKYDAVKVNVVDADKKPVILDSTASTDVLTASTGSTAAIKFTVKADEYDGATTAKYNVAGLTTTPAEATGVGNQQTVNGVATGNSAVTITVTGLTKKAPTYSVTVDPATLTSTGVALSTFGINSTTDKNAVLKVSLGAAVSGKPEGWRFDTAGVKVSLGAAPADVYAYKITIAGMGSVVLNSTYTADSATALSTDTKVIPLTEDIKITQDMISVTVVEKKMAIESASWKNGVLTVKFSADVLATSATKDKFTFAVGTDAGGSANTNASVVSSAVVKGDTVEITFSGDPLVAGNTVTVDKGVASNVTNTNVLDAAKNYVITLNADGTAAVAKAS